MQEQFPHVETDHFLFHDRKEYCEGCWRGVSNLVFSIENMKIKIHEDSKNA